MFFGNKTQKLLNDAETTIKQQQDLIEHYTRHYEKQQKYIESLYDVIGDLTHRLGMALDTDNWDRLEANPYLEENSDFYLDMGVLFSARMRKRQNVTCYFGKELALIKKKFQDRDFRNASLVYLTERFTLDDLLKLFKNRMWKKPLKESLESIRKERGLLEPGL